MVLRLRKFTPLLVLLAWLGVATPSAGEDIGLYLFLIEGVNKLGKLDVDSRQPLKVTLHTRAVDDLSELLNNTNAQVLAVQGEAISLSLPRSTVNLAPPTQADLAATWVIDFDEPAVVELSQAMSRSLGERPSVPAITEFVADFISDKNYVNTFDLASQVASSAEGDCTEHAVLTTALARAQGYPARVVFGAALMLGSAGELEVAGHAWSEIYDGQRWQLADAALLGVEAQAAIYYVPWSIMRQEGPSFTLAMFDLMARRPHLVVVEAL